MEIKPDSKAIKLNQGKDVKGDDKFKGKGFGADKPGSSAKPGTTMKPGTTGKIGSR